MRTVYLILAIVGAIVPIYFFLQFFTGGPQPAGVTEFLPALYVNGAAGGFASDLFISSIVFWAWMWTRRGAGPNMAIFVALNLSIGLSCALPAYLWATTQKN